MPGAQRVFRLHRIFADGSGATMTAPRRDLVRAAQLRLLGLGEELGQRSEDPCKRGLLADTAARIRTSEAAPVYDGRNVGKCERP